MRAYVVVLQPCGLKHAFIENFDEGLSYHLIETSYSSVLLMQHLDCVNESSGSCFWILYLMSFCIKLLRLNSKLSKVVLFSRKKKFTKSGRGGK